MPVMRAKFIEENGSIAKNDFCIDSFFANPTEPLRHRKVRLRRCGSSIHLHVTLRRKWLCATWATQVDTARWSKSSEGAVSLCQAFNQIQGLFVSKPLSRRI